MKKNISSQSIGAEIITAADGTAFTGSVSVLVTKDNGTQTAGAGTAPAHEGNGYHSYTPTQAETNADHIAFTFTGAGAIPATIQLYTNFPQSVDNATGIADIPTVSEFNARTIPSADYFDPAVDTVANVTLVGTTTTNTDMRGTDSAATAAQVTALNDFNPTTDTVANVTLVATTTANTDMRGTDNALLASSYTTPPSAASISTAVWGETTRELTSGNNIVLAKGVGVTGFNDIAATDIVTGGAITTSLGNANVDVVKINGTTVIGAGNAGNLWRA